MTGAERRRLAEDRDKETLWGWGDSMLAAGDNLAEKLRELDDSPWTVQILEEWEEAKRFGDR